MSSSKHEPNTQKELRKPAFAYFPGIKIYNPPQGPFSPKTDEWCITYCTQSIGGRAHRKLPNCRSVCIRKVFPHEVRNIISFKQHQTIGPDGKAKYPLPPEGQPANIPRILGGKPPVTLDEDDEDYDPRQQPPPPETRHWDEGWYVWSTSTFNSTMKKLVSMSMDFENLRRHEEKREKERARWIEYQQFVERNAGHRDSGLLNKPPEEQDSKWYGLKVPPPPMPAVDTTRTILLPLSFDSFTIWDRISKFLDPTRTALSLTHDSITSGEQKRFALNLWEKALSNEPWVLASRTFGRAYELWKKSDDDDEERRTP
ncbi:hypothetical protein E1B28_010095 [Marasmius oreades]|uniref:Uncharacterized protein n=1 Tax=Marasmius oreades TaxID=181124 RepID=A0A9P7RWM2_9AGAR|nr:uncharacterized protein E1B28_010095 [Marasmius oreades]KAG7091035.1 hypothetical protein E1B28_010095 [Marasmius oreades]